MNYLQDALETFIKKTNSEFSVIPMDHSIVLSSDEKLVDYLSETALYMSDIHISTHTHISPEIVDWIPVEKYANKYTFGLFFKNDLFENNNTTDKFNHTVILSNDFDFCGMVSGLLATNHLANLELSNTKTQMTNKGYEGFGDNESIYIEDLFINGLPCIKNKKFNKTEQFENMDDITSTILQKHMHPFENDDKNSNPNSPNSSELNFNDPDFDM